MFKDVEIKILVTLTVVVLQLDRLFNPRSASHTPWGFKKSQNLVPTAEFSTYRRIIAKFIEIFKNVKNIQHFLTKIRVQVYLCRNFFSPNFFHRILSFTCEQLQNLEFLMQNTEFVLQILPCLYCRFKTFFRRKPWGVVSRRVWPLTQLLPQGPGCIVYINYVQILWMSLWWYCV